MSTVTSKPNHLDPSELGTKQYWDALYATELTNIATNPSDEGTVWFDDSDAESKILSFLAEQLSPLRLSREYTSFLDLGCGNGSLLFALRDAGWRGRALGVDYSEASVALALRVGAGRRRRAEEEGHNGVVDGDVHDTGKRLEGGEEEGIAAQAHDRPLSAPAPGGRPVEFLVWDVLAGPLEAVRPSDIQGSAEQKPWEGWDVVLDKGTFDAVSLSSARDEAGRRVCEGYRDRVLQLLRRGGIFLVTSCNWTEAELKGWFEGEGEVGRLEQVGRVEYRSFSFGGVKGQTISTVCFMKL